MKMETERLTLRELTMEDFDALHKILSDPLTMRHYPMPFDETRTRGWIAKNMERYAEHGFGLWAVILKETGELIGDCGITMQNIHGVIRPEIGYHIRRDLWRKGYASEAARACMEFIFEQTMFDSVYSYMKYTNVASYGVALKNGMTFIEEYDDPVNMRTRVYAISREAWQALKAREVRRHD
ncbi:MAG: GNAT family N-acetyltransferase [Clostridia bacterium]|nr:GNAT family N-acetyltransferase [Clostridia bacterium]